MTSRLRQNTIIEVLIIELIFGTVWYFIYSPLLTNLIVIFGDLGLPDLNSGIISQLFIANPNYTGILFTLIYNYNQEFLPAFWDYYILLIPLLTPLGFYYLMKSMDFKIHTRVTATVFYSVNPLVILFAISGLEYTGIFFFFPIILAFIIKYHMNNNIQNLINAGIFTFLLFIFLGIDYLKFVVFISLGLILMDLFYSGKTSITRKLKVYAAWLVSIAFISLPMLIFLFSSIAIFYRASSTNVSTVSSLVDITRFEYSASNLEVSLYALPYVANQLTSLNYESAWYGALYLFIILFSLASVLKYRSKYRKVYYTLFIVLLFLILFQYGVYNGTFIGLFERIPLLGLYNYPLFMNISQLLIYAMFFAISYEYVVDYLGNQKKKLWRFKKVLVPTLAVVFVALILIASVPVIDYEHNTNASFARNNELPNYILNLTEALKPYSNSRVMILPDNSSSLTYVYTGVSYYDVYGFPYGYQNFLSLFPNLTVFQEIGSAFENGNASLVASLLESQDISAIVVLHTMENNPITASGTVINGGGIQFGNILNSTSVYVPKIWNDNYALYAFNPSGSLVQIKNVSNNNLSVASYSKVNESAIVTSGLSYQSIPITVNISVSNYSASYNPYILLNRTSLEFINANFSNIMFYSSNGNPIYAWISSISNNTAGIYLKINHSINQTIYIRVYPEFENKLSGSGYLGEAPEISGTGTNVLPSNILYSSVAVGVYGYGYSGGVYTMNFTFNPSDFKNVENSNLSNVAFYAYNGGLLNASLQGSVNNTSSSATVTISFNGGVPYFEMKSSGHGGSGNQYNVFYIGFADKSSNLDALNANVKYNVSSSHTVINVAYLPYAVRDFGTYNKYDNGKYVFPYFNDYLNEQAFANPWEFNIPVSGYGFLSGLNTYSPLAYSNYYLTTLNPGQEGISYSHIFGGQTASPLYVSEDNYSSMMGYYSNTSYIFAPNFNQTLQQHSTDIGFGSNNSYIAIYDNYNNSATYTSKTLYSTTTNGFTNYSVCYSGNILHFAINGNSLINTTTNLSSPDLMTSSVGTGSMNTIYSLVLNSTTGNATINIGRASVFQAYFAGLPLQNPVYTNTSVIFSSFSTGIGNSNSTWKINNESFKGQFVAYRFNISGNYSIQLASKNKIYNLIEEVISKPTSSKAINTCFLGAGSHVISTPGGSGVYLWYVNGKYVKDNSSKLIYNFPYQGYYTIKVFVLNSYGSYAYSYIVNVKKQNTLLTVKDILFLMYNTILPIISIIYLLDNRLKSTVNKNFNRFFRLLVRKV